MWTLDPNAAYMYLPWLQWRGLARPVVCRGGREAGWAAAAVLGPTTRLASVVDQQGEGGLPVWIVLEEESMGSDCLLLLLLAAARHVED